MHIKVNSTECTCNFRDTFCTSSPVEYSWLPHPAYSWSSLPTEWLTEIWCHVSIIHRFHFAKTFSLMTLTVTHGLTDEHNGQAWINQFNKKKNEVFFLLTETPSII